MNRYAASLLTAIVTAAALAMPMASASATPTPNNYGSTVTCRYEVTQEGRLGWTEALLKKIVVQPPTIYAKNGAQQVGWQFVVKRSLDRWDTPWVETYRSIVQKRQATTSTPADFDAMRVRVNVPTDVEDQQHVWYQLTLKVVWYAVDGRVGSKASSRFSDYTLHVADEDGASDLYCEGLVRQWFN